MCPECGAMCYINDMEISLDHGQEFRKLTLRCHYCGTKTKMSVAVISIEIEQPSPSLKYSLYDEYYIRGGGDPEPKKEIRDLELFDFEE